MLGQYETTIELYVPPGDAGAKVVRHKPLLLRGAWYVLEAVFVPDVDVVADDTDYATISLYSGEVELHAATTEKAPVGTGDLTAGEPLEVALPAGAARTLRYGDIVVATKDAGGSGAALSGTYVLRLERRPDVG